VLIIFVRFIGISWGIIYNIKFALREAQVCNQSQNEEDENKSYGSIETFPSDSWDIPML